MRRSLLAAGLAVGLAAPAPAALANSRTGVSERPPLDVRTTARPVAASSLRTSLGGEAIVQLDSTTGLPKVIAREHGFLSAPSSAAAPAIARSYLASHAALFG